MSGGWRVYVRFRAINPGPWMLEDDGFSSFEEAHEWAAEWSEIPEGFAILVTTQDPNEPVEAAS